jgi:hypothetical protein
MKFKLWLEDAGKSFEVSLKKIYGWKPKVAEAVKEVISGETSRTEGTPLVSRLDSPKGAFFIIDGYHRIIEKAMSGGVSIVVTIDEFTPRIERTGGAHRNMLEDKIPILSYKEFITI